MTYTKEDAEKSARENWRLSHEWRAQGKDQYADAAAKRAIENEKEADSWFYRTFGW